MVEPGLSVLASAFFKSVMRAAPDTPATGAKPQDWSSGAKRATTSGATPVMASGVAIGISTWPLGTEATACVPAFPAPAGAFRPSTNSLNSREFSLKEISENETGRGWPPFWSPALSLPCPCSKTLIMSRIGVMPAIGSLANWYPNATAPSSLPSM